jgi:predicted RecA/RadA family phage recombinase
MATTTYRQTGDLIDYTPGSNVSAGDIVVASELVGQVPQDILANTKGSLRIEGIINAPKLSTDVVALGDVLYWDAGNTRCTTTASTHKIIGKAVEAAGNGVADVDLKLTPNMLTP